MIDNIKNLQKFPAVVSGIYFLYKNFRLVYVGRTENLFQRIGTHIHGDKDFDSFSFLEVSPDELEKAEYDFIEFFNPPLNVTKPVLRVSDEQFEETLLWGNRINKSKHSFSSFAELCSVPQPMLSQYINGKLKPRVDHFTAINDAFDRLGV